MAVFIKKIWWTQNVFSSLQLFWNISHSKAILQSIIVYVLYIGLHETTYYSYQILFTLEFSWQIFEKYSNIKFCVNMSSGNQVVLCRWTNRHVKANTCFSQFCQCTWKGYNLLTNSTNLPCYCLTIPYYFHLDGERVNYCTTLSIYKCSLPLSISNSLKYVLILYTTTFSMLKLCKTLMNRRFLPITITLVPF